MSGVKVGGVQTLKNIVALALIFVIAASQVARAERPPQNLTLRRELRIKCEMVRNYVKQLGLEQAKVMALAAGMTPTQEHEAARCLQRRI